MRYRVPFDDSCERVEALRAHGDEERVQDAAAEAKSMYIN